MISETPPTAASLPVATAKGVTDEERQPQPERQPKESKSQPAPTASATSGAQANPSEKADHTAEDSLARQIVDSEKVVELLSHRPAPQSSAHPYVKQNRLTLTIDKKKVNRSL